MARASMCIDCIKFNTDRCKMLGKVSETTMTILLLMSDCDGSENFFHKIDNKYVCRKCGRDKVLNDHGCSCTLNGEYEYLKWRGVK